MDADRQPPVGLIKLGHAFYNHDYSCGMKDFGKWAAYAIKIARLTKEEQVDVEAYLDRILSKYNDSQIDYIWSQIGTSVYIATSDSSAARTFFTKIRDCL
jgi:hypothetical protein